MQTGSFLSCPFNLTAQTEVLSESRELLPKATRCKLWLRRRRGRLQIDANADRKSELTMSRPMFQQAVTRLKFEGTGLCGGHFHGQWHYQRDLPKTRRTRLERARVCSSYPAQSRAPRSAVT